LFEFFHFFSLSLFLQVENINNEKNGFNDLRKANVQSDEVLLMIPSKCKDLKLLLSQKLKYKNNCVLIVYQL